MKTLAVQINYYDESDFLSIAIVDTENSLTIANLRTYCYMTSELQLANAIALVMGHAVAGFAVKFRHGANE